MGGFVILIIVFAAAWLLFVLPARRRRMSHAAMQDTIEAGDDVITAGGLHGTVRSLEGATVELEIAPDVVVTLDRRAVAAVARDVEVVTEVENLDEGRPDPG
jgi:preprotein translocase subunit YajC